EPLDGFGDLAFQAVVELAACSSSKARVNSAHAPVPAQEERCRPGVQVHGLRQFGVQLAGLATQEHSVIYSVLADKRAQPGGVLQLIRLFERERYDFEALATIRPVQLLEERRLVMTIRAPASHDAHDHDFVLKSAVCVRDDFSG